ncbi:sensor domain-containing diguanylate cyclase [Aerophototrophica crusticola]|uniref:diguanylate cyclase n=1 Tax=Aerophototrophica crusticola TaxID=1709002 RepID=A0A858R7D8_9PROT|nr:sensor domain-containing diguanylate cyclase [Rhodospirillaceae bacterium B3]
MTAALLKSPPVPVAALDPTLAKADCAEPDLDGVLWSILAGTAGKTGEDFLHSLVEHLARLLRVKLVMVTRPADHPPTKATVLAASKDGVRQDSFTYPLAGLPCALVLGAGRVVEVPCDLATTFPAEVGGGYSAYLGIPLMDQDGILPLGHLAVLDDRPLVPNDRRSAIVRIFATRAEAELRRLRLEAELRRQASTDPLTGVDNRRAFLAALEGEIYRARRYDHPLSLLAVDADRFKQVNDSYGHQVGDTVLVALAEIMRANIRASDRVGRLGGEEFAILLPETDLAGAEAVAEKLHRAVRRLSIPASHGMINVTISIGAAQMARAGEPVESLLTRADHALYTAKHLGRDQTVTAGA